MTGKISAVAGWLIVSEIARAGVRCAWACSVCFNDPGSPLTRGLWAAVLFLLGVTAFVLAAIASTGFVWYRRSRQRTETASAL